MYRKTPNRADVGINFRMGSMKMDTPGKKRQIQTIFQTKCEYMVFQYLSVPKLKMKSLTYIVLSNQRHYGTFYFGMFMLEGGMVV